jgi:K+-sensing histidine kinase KdpD
MKKILIIEDDQLVRISTLDLLEAEGFQATGAENGRIGLEKAREQLPDLIICDILMPELDGYEVLKALQQDLTTATIPFIFLTASADKTALRHGMELGADDYLTKPFTLSHLLAAIDARLKKQATFAQQQLTEIKQAEDKLYELLRYGSLSDLEQVARILEAAAILIYLPQANNSEELTVKASYLSEPQFKQLFSSELAKLTFEKKETTYYRLENRQRLAYLALLQGAKSLGVMAVLLQDNNETAETFDTEIQPRLLTMALQMARTVDHDRLVKETAQVSHLKESNELKTTLLASVSHELRTPLTSIKAAVAGLKNDHIGLKPDEQREYLHLIEDEVDRLDHLITKILDLSQIEAGLLKPEKGLYYLPEVINSIVDRLVRTPTLANHQVDTHFEKQLPLVPFDYIQIEQVIINLVENAAKYSSPDSQITINVLQATCPSLPNYLPPVGSNDDRMEQMGVLVEIADEGIGIAEADLEQIFFRFYRANQSGSNQSRIKGSGMGLAICKGIIEAHCGRIWVRVRPERGSIFTFWLPL